MNKSRFLLPFLVCFILLTASNVIYAEDFSMSLEDGVNYYIESDSGLRFGYDFWDEYKEYSEIQNGTSSAQNGKTVVTLPTDEPYWVWLEKPENDYSEPFDVEVSTPQSAVTFKQMHSSYGYASIHYAEDFNNYSDELIATICYPFFIPQIVIDPKTDLGPCQIAINTEFETSDDSDTFVEAPIVIQAFNNAKDNYSAFYIFANNEDNEIKYVDSYFNIDIEISYSDSAGVKRTAKTNKSLQVNENGIFEIYYGDLINGTNDYFYADLDGDDNYEIEGAGSLFTIEASEQSEKPEETQPADFTIPDGIRYSIPEDDDFTFSNATKTETLNAGNGVAGTFRMSGNIHDNGSVNGVPAYTIENNEVVLSYAINEAYAASLLTSDWDYRYDDIKRIDNESIYYHGEQSYSIKGDCVFFQSSKDGKYWNTYDFAEMMLSDTMLVKIYKEDHQTYDEKLYKTSLETGLHPLHLEGGFYYRVVFEYQLEKDRENAKFYQKQHDYMNYVEVFQFYLSYDGEEPLSANEQRYRLGSRVKTGDNFYGVKDIGTKDKHYGWDIGYFFVTGFTEHRVVNGKDVFLKNVGDDITLWFQLTQNIDKLNDKPNLEIEYDQSITDQNFELPKTNFGRGAIIIRKTNYQNIVEDPVIYYNFLEANAFPFANTEVELFEEGDYEVALDYSISGNHYRIAFEYSIRNSNCMVFPFDVMTKSELGNSSYTENGFYLDLARSRYLDINVKRVIMNNGAEDIRFNRSARDGEEYTDEGIYIITVKNKVTGEQTEKRIYVGADYQQYSQTW